MGLLPEWRPMPSGPRPYEEISENDLEPKQDPTLAPVLPGCSKGNGHATKWEMSTTTMQTYLFMKGQGTDKDDPLLQYIRKQESEILDECEDKLWEDITNSIKEQGDWRIHGPSQYEEEDRQSTFQYTRPKIDHINLPQSFDSEMLKEMCQNHDKQVDGWAEYAASVVSDDEGDPEDGRVSPCTFLRWAEGAKRWDDPSDKNKTRWENRRAYELPEERQRPPSPNTLEPREPKDRFKEAQLDENGHPLSAACSEYANTEPSILWSPPPMNATLPSDFYNRKLDRMDPQLAQALRDSVTSVVPSWGVKSAEGPESYSRTEIEEAVEKYWGVDRTHDIIERKHQELAHLRFYEEHVNDVNERYRHVIRRLKHENRKLADCAHLQRATRDRRIMRGVDRHMRELDYESKLKMCEVKARYREMEGLQQEFQEMKMDQEMLLAQLGKQSPEEVFDEFPDVWEDLEYRKNRRNFS